MKQLFFAVLISFFLSPLFLRPTLAGSYCCICTIEDERVVDQRQDPRLDSAVSLDLNALCSRTDGVSCTGSPGSCPSTSASPSAGSVNAQDSRVVKLDNPLKNNATSVSVILGTIIKNALGVMGGLTLLMLIWGGFQWLTSAGSPEKVKKGSQTMIWAAVGTFLVLASYLILTTFLKYLTGAE